MLASEYDALRARVKAMDGTLNLPPETGKS
jgi:hypothetical protein